MIWDVIQILVTKAGLMQAAALWIGRIFLSQWWQKMELSTGQNVRKENQHLA
jgi:hypothetical protein